MKSINIHIMVLYLDSYSPHSFLRKQYTLFNTCESSFKRYSKISIAAPVLGWTALEGILLFCLHNVGV